MAGLRDVKYLVTRPGIQGALDSETIVGVAREEPNIRGQAIRDAIRIDGLCYRIDEHGFLERIWPPRR